MEQSEKRNWTANCYAEGGSESRGGNFPTQEEAVHTLMKWKDEYLKHGDNPVLKLTNPDGRDVPVS